MNPSVAAPATPDAGTTLPAAVAEPVPQSDGLRPWVAGLVLAVFLAGFALPYVVTNDFYLGLAVEGVIFGLLALSIGWLLRQTGLVSFGHAAYFGTAAYVVAVASTRWQWPIAASVAAGLLASVVLAGLVGLLIVRVPGISFAMLTLAVGQALYVIITKLRDQTGGFDGLPLRFEGTVAGWERVELGEPAVFWPVVWVALGSVMVGLWALSRTHYGRLLAAIRENEVRARYCGFRTYLPRVAAFTLSGAISGLGGLLFIIHNSFVSPETVFWTTSGNALVMALVGGVASVAGPPLGAVLFFFGRDEFSAGTDRWQLVLGSVLIALVIFAPGGLASLAARTASAVGRRFERSRHGRA